MTRQVVTCSDLELPPCTSLERGNSNRQSRSVKHIGARSRHTPDRVTLDSSACCHPTETENSPPRRSLFGTASSSQTDSLSKSPQVVLTCAGQLDCETY